MGLAGGLPYSESLVAPAEVGRGYGAKDIEAMRVAALSKRLEDVRPDLKEKGVALAYARLTQQAAEERFNVELAGGVGNDFVQEAKKIFNQEAERLFRLEQLKKV